MKNFAKDISYRVFYFALAIALLYILPTLAHLFSEFAAMFFIPLLENAIQNIGK